MLFGFSSIGKAEATLEESRALANRFGLDFLELRALGRTVDLPAYFRSSGEDAAPDGVQSSCPVRLVAASLRLTDGNDGDIRQFVETARLADQLGARYLRVFGGGQWNQTPDRLELEHAVRVVTESRRQLRELGLKMEILLETHDAFSSSETCASLNRLLEEPLQILWDSHHTWKLAGESPETTWARLGPYIRHLHYKDSISQNQAAEGYAYVMPGSGEYPTEGLLALLQREKFEEGVSLEWEKLWHPGLLPLEDALEHFQKIVATCRKAK